jgi:hypothetical protein
VATTSVDNTMRAALGFSPSLSFRVFQQYPQVAVIRCLRKVHLSRGRGFGCLQSSSCAAFSPICELQRTCIFGPAQAEQPTNQLAKTDFHSHEQTIRQLGSGLIDQSQKMTAAAVQIGETKVWAQRSYRVWTRRQSLILPNMFSMRWRCL